MAPSTPPSGHSKTIVITGASSGFGAMTARALADAGHTVYAGVREMGGRNATAVRELRDHADAHGLTIHAVEMDVADQASVDLAINEVLRRSGRIDVVIHNAGHMVLGPAEAFTVEQIANVYDVNVLSTQRVNRALLPQLRSQRDGLVIWVGSSSCRGGIPPFLGPYFAAKAAEDALAVSYAMELTRFGIETTIVVPGAFTTGTQHYAHAGHPGDMAVSSDYDRLYHGLTSAIPARQAEMSPPDADPDAVAREIVRVVGLPKGQRPFRVHVDPVHDGAEEVFDLEDGLRRAFLQRLGYPDLWPVARVDVEGR